MGHHGVSQWGYGSIWGHFGPFWVLLGRGLVQLGWDPNLLLPSHP